MEWKVRKAVDTRLTTFQKLTIQFHFPNKTHCVWPMLILVIRSSFGSRYVAVRHNEPLICPPSLPRCTAHRNSMCVCAVVGSDSVMRQWRCQADDGCARLATIDTNTPPDCIPAHETHTHTVGLADCPQHMELIWSLLATQISLHVEERSNELILCLCLASMVKMYSWTSPWNRGDSSTLSLTSGLDGGCLTPHRDRFTPGKGTRYPLYRSLSGPQGLSKRVRKTSPHRNSIPSASSL